MVRFLTLNKSVDFLFILFKSHIFAALVRKEIIMRRLLVSLVALFASVAMIYAQNIEQATELAKQAKEALASRDYPAALEKFERALTEAEACGEKGNEIAEICRGVIPQIHIQQGIELMEQECWALAADDFKTVLDADPTNGEAALLYGIAMDREGELEEALQAYRIAAENGQKDQAEALLAEHERLAEAQQVKIESGTHEYDFKVYFPYDDARFSPDYLDNPATLARLDSVINVHGLDAIDAFVVVAKSSPEGRYQYNMNLAERRALSMRDYLLKRFPELKDKVTLEHGVSPWPASRDKKDLVRLRYAAFRMVFPYDIDLPTPAPMDSSLFAVNVAPALDVNIPEPVVLSDKYKQMIFALKTNLLYDAVTALNFEVEVPIGDRISIMWEDVFPWWEKNNKYCFQHWEMGPEVRYWFKPWDPRGTEKLYGFFAGIYGMSAKYDFQYDRSLDYQGEYWSTGISAGWTTPLGRTKWCNLELSLAAGFARTHYRGYIPADDYSLLIRNPYDVGSLDWWGPTKAKVSFVIPICINRTRTGGTK